MTWNCPACGKLYEVPPNCKVECWCQTQFGIAPPNTKRDDPFEGVLVKRPVVHVSPVNAELK